MMKFYSKFITLRTPHNAQPFLKSMFEDVWKHCEKELTETSANRFRTVTDYTPELFRAWQMCTGNFTPYNTCLLYTSPSPRDVEESRMPSSA